MIFVGYHTYGGYRLFDPIAKQVKISRDVIVDEFKNWSSESDTKKKYSELTFQLDSNSSNEANEKKSDVRRSNKTRTTSVISEGFDVISDSHINDTCDLIHLALFAEDEPVKLNEALKSEK